MSKPYKNLDKHFVACDMCTGKPKKWRDRNTEGMLSMRASIVFRPGKTPDSFEIEASVPFAVTEDDGGFTAYTPFLDFSTCGKDQADAEEMFKKGIVVFLKELVRMGTLDEFLREQGWRKSPLPRKPDRWVPPELIWKEETLRTAVVRPA